MLGHIDLFLRGGFMGTTLLACLILALNPMTRKTSPSLLAVGITLFTVLMLPDRISGDWPDFWKKVIDIVHPLSGVALAWFIYDVFMDRHQQMGAGRVLLVLAGITAAVCLIAGNKITVVVIMLALFYLSLLVFAILSAKGDLIESRRRFRIVFVFMIGAFGFAKSMTLFLYPGHNAPVSLDLIEAAGYYLFAVFFAVWAFRPAQDCCVEETVFANVRSATTRPADKKTRALIKQAIDEELWRREGLTIGDMSQELGVAEHRLRVVINRDMGYRNFASFVNGYRIDAAKEALSSLEQSDRTVLEIAYECGFASLAPFNKAFRAVTGRTPTDYRRQALSDGSLISI